MKMKDETHDFESKMNLAKNDGTTTAKTLLQKLSALMGVNTGEIKHSAEAAKRLEDETSKALSRMVEDMADTSVAERAARKSAQAAQITKDLLGQLPALAALLESKDASLQEAMGSDLSGLLGSLEKL